MVLSYEWQEYHLTPKGWINGTFRGESGRLEEAPTPSDRVLSYRVEETMNSPKQGIEREIYEIWRGSMST
jgi:hypothetical protein